MSAPALAESRRLVIKIGSALLVDQDSGRVHQTWLAALIADLAARHKQGTQILLVSSGAVAVGRRALRLPPGPLGLKEKQAAAAAGQIRLAHAYEEALARHGLPCAQVLLTLTESESRRHFLNARDTVLTLLRLGAVPVINENDSITTEEIRVGDNDRLAARVAQMVQADTLVLLSDIDGLYTVNPRQDPDATFLPTVTALTPEIMAMAGDPDSVHGTGGMITKLAAARVAMSGGCRMLITDGRGPDPLGRIGRGETRGTWFLPDTEPRSAYKHWIAAGLHPRGSLTLDAGAVRALAVGGSLLPVGVTGVAGDFRRGDAVRLLDADGHEVGRGLVAYDSGAARRLAGHKSREIETLLGYRGRDEMIHRDNLVVY